MRFASWLFVGVSVLIVASVVVVSCQRKGAARGQGAGFSRFAAPLVIPPDENAVRRLEAKAAVARRLIDGELTLLEAAAWLRYINTALPLAGSVPFPGEAGMSETECYCRQAIRWAETTAANESPSQAEVVRRRLTAELSSALHTDHSVELPALQ